MDTHLMSVLFCLIKLNVIQLLSTTKCCNLEASCKAEFHLRHNQFSCISMTAVVILPHQCNFSMEREIADKSFPQIQLVWYVPQSRIA